MFLSVPRWLPLALITLAALWLRTQDLDRRPMHADEANQAVKTGELLETGKYAFDPQDHHGPTLYYAAIPIAWIRGERTLASLSETTVRLVPALAGAMAVVLVGLLALPLGRWPSLAAAAFVAVAPPAVYYSRYFVQETLLVTFTLGTFVCTQRWWRSAQMGWAIAAGVGMGLMQATKASAPLFMVAALLGGIVARPHAPAGPHRGRAATAALLAALAVAAILYSSFGTHLAGLRDAIAVYAPAAERAADGSGHEKPWWYYLRLFGWHQNGGLLWQQLGFSMLAILGIVVALTRRAPLLRGAAVYTIIVAVVLSAIPYKTPWHSIHLVPGFAVLAAGALGFFPRPSIAVGLMFAVLFSQFRQTKLVAFLRPADARNPYAYVHSSPDVMKFRALADAALAGNPNGIVRVISEEYWPLPWYLRGLTQVGYWSSPPENCDGALIIASAEQSDSVRSRLNGAYRETYLGLRPGLLTVVFTPES